MKKGKYYIGDPCYVFGKSWEDFLSNLRDDEECIVFKKTVFAGSTAYGDGEYSDNYGRKYGVDAGLIGVIPVSLLKKDNVFPLKEVVSSGYAHIINMPTDFECSNIGGLFKFGDITINTINNNEDEYEVVYWS